jgi:ketol-acid reductoisomerase
MSSQITNTKNTQATQDTIAIISVGNQAQSWAQNLHDSGVKIEVLYRTENDSVKNFKNQFPHIPCQQLSKESLQNKKIIALLIPDDQHLNFLKEYETSITHQSLIIYAHGFSEVAYKLSHHFPQFTHALLAPKAIASELRKNYLEKKTLAAVYGICPSIHPQNEILDRLKILAKSLGITWGPFLVTFEQECKADLFSEQTLLCNLLPNVLNKAHQKLIDKNIPWELAFCEIFLELKLIVNALEQVGPEKFYQLISPNALMGSEYYRKKWNQELPFEKIFEDCWQKLETGEMIKYLMNTDPTPIRNSILKEWNKNSLTQSYSNFIESSKRG